MSAIQIAGIVAVAIPCATILFVGAVVLGLLVLVIAAPVFLVCDIAAAIGRRL